MTQVGLSNIKNEINNDFSDATKPLTVFVEKLSEHLGDFWRPGNTVRIAKADSQALLIKTKAAIDARNLILNADVDAKQFTQRAAHRLALEAIEHQANLESIARGAIPLISQTAKPEELKSDWLARFFDSCRNVSDENVQILFSKILAGQANTPGSFSRRAVSTLTDLSKNDIEVFTKLCGFTVELFGISPIVTDYHSGLYLVNSINFETLSHLDSIGLIRFWNAGDFFITQIPEEITCKYFDRKFRLRFPKKENNKLSLGCVKWTETGRELSQICAVKPVREFPESFEMWLRKKEIQFMEIPPSETSNQP